jgi:quercetin dioxygenase-like cupin family protein
VRLLKEDGVQSVFVDKFENQTLTRVKDLCQKMGDRSWAMRVVANERFGGTLICQKPGEGNRLHYHPDSDECWVILEGEWEWYIEGVGTKRVKKGDIVLVRKGTKHRIKCKGRKPGIRFAITKFNVEHVYADRNGRPNRLG